MQHIIIICYYLQCNLNPSTLSYKSTIHSCDMFHNLENIKGTVFTVITFWASWNNQNLLSLFIINKWIDQCKKYQNIKEICLTFVTVCSNISIFTTVKAYSTKRVAGCIIFAIIITSFTAVYSKKSIWAFYNL